MSFLGGVFTFLFYFLLTFIIGGGVVVGLGVLLIKLFE